MGLAVTVLFVPREILRGYRTVVMDGSKRGAPDVGSESLDYSESLEKSKKEKVEKDRHKVITR